MDFGWVVGCVVLLVSAGLTHASMIAVGGDSSSADLGWALSGIGGATWL